MSVPAPVGNPVTMMIGRLGQSSACAENAAHAAKASTAAKTLRTTPMSHLPGARIVSGSCSRRDRRLASRHDAFRPHVAADLRLTSRHDAAHEAIMVTLDDIRGAARLIRGAVLRTPTLPAPNLSALTGAEIFVKYDNLQVTGSFKERGALVKLASLDEAARRAGVIAMSAGNHAQAVAYHARRLAIPATIVMPVTTPYVKVAATEAHGADVVLDGDTLTEAQARAEAIADERQLTWVHPY